MEDQEMKTAIAAQVRKEEYFSTSAIAATAQAMAAALPVNRRAAAFCPATAALLVVDMQRYFLCAGSHARIPAAPAIIGNINILVAAFKKAARPVFFTRHGNDDRDGGQMAAWWGDWLRRGHPLADIDDAIDCDGLPVIEKTQYDAFFGTDLDARLKQANVRQLAVCGVATHLCCESTARSAFAHGFAVFVAVDATATWNRELHQASLRAMAHGCAVPFLTRDLQSSFGERA
jgi:nicotinamidase-related amidase